jgi:peptidoglycan/LPS O-acetylase OafA/YrhL
MLSYSLGLFTGNPKDDFVNDPVWTIKIEVMFYIMVPLLVAVCRRFGTWQTLSTLFVASLAFRLEARHFHMARIAHQLPGGLSYFR